MDVNVRPLLMAENKMVVTGVITTQNEQKDSQLLVLDLLDRCERNKSRVHILPNGGEQW